MVNVGLDFRVMYAKMNIQATNGKHTESRMATNNPDVAIQKTLQQQLTPLSQVCQAKLVF